jgi:leucyl-tRNA synthetase
MDRAYNPQQIETKWQRVWAEQQTIRVTDEPVKTLTKALDRLRLF